LGGGLGSPVALSSAFSPSPTFTAPLDNADRLLTFALVVSDDGFITTSIPDIVNIVINDETSFDVSTTLDNGVISGSETIGDIFAGSTYTLQIDGVLSSAELQQLVIPTGVSGSGVTFDFTESSQVASGIVEPNLETALFLDLTFGGVDFSQSSSFESGIPPKIQFLVDSGFTSTQSFADGCAVVEIELLNEFSGQWEQIGDPQKPNTNKIYVTNDPDVFSPGTLVVIDGTINEKIAEIPVGFSPKIIAFDQTTNRIYVANQGSNSVSVVDGSTNSVIDEILVGLAPLEPSVNPNTGLVYVTNQGDGTVSVIDGMPGSPTENTVIATIDTENLSPTGIDVDTSLNKIYVSNTFASVLTVIDGDPGSGAFNKKIGSIFVPQPAGLAIDSDNNRAYITNFDDRGVTVIDTTSDTIIGFIPVGPGPTKASFNPTTNRLYVTNLISASVSIVDTEIGSQVTTVPVTTGFNPFSVDVNPNTNRAYVANRGSGTVSVIDGMPGSPTENTVIHTFTGFSNNFGVAINPDVPNPVRDPSSDVAGQCAYIAQPPHFSKFAIGGVSLAVAGLAGGGGVGAGGPTLSVSDFILYDIFEFPDEVKAIAENYDPFVPLSPITIDAFEDFDFPLIIDNDAYLLVGYENTIETHVIQSESSITMTLTFYESSEIAHVSLYTNLNGIKTKIDQSDTQILFYKDKPIEVIDPHGYFGDVKFSINEIDDIKKQAIFEITFVKPMKQSDIIIRAWDDSLHSKDVIIRNAIEVVDPNAEPIFEETIPEPVVEQLKPKNVPMWIKNNAYWWSQEMIEDSDFVAGIEYLIQEEIITISESGDVAANSSDEIPTWIKNNAGWWSEDLITEQEFIDGLQWLISIGVISVGKTG